MIDALPPGGRILVMCRHIAPAPELVEFQVLVRQRCTEIEEMLLNDDRLQLDLSAEAPPGIRLTGFDALLLSKGNAQ